MAHNLIVTNGIAWNPSCCQDRRHHREVPAIGNSHDGTSSLRKFFTRSLAAMNPRNTEPSGGKSAGPVPHLWLDCTAWTGWLSRSIVALTHTQT